MIQIFLVHKIITTNVFNCNKENERSARFVQLRTLSTELCSEYIIISPVDKADERMEVFTSCSPAARHKTHISHASANKKESVRFYARSICAHFIKPTGAGGDLWFAKQAAAAETTSLGVSVAQPSLLINSSRKRTLRETNDCSRWGFQLLILK
jgi:hypothetical protein